MIYSFVILFNSDRSQKTSEIFQTVQNKSSIFMTRYSCVIFAKSRWFFIKNWNFHIFRGVWFCHPNQTICIVNFCQIISYFTFQHEVMIGENSNIFHQIFQIFMSVQDLF